MVVMRKILTCINYTGLLEDQATGALKPYTLLVAIALACYDLFLQLSSEGKTSEVMRKRPCQLYFQTPDLLFMDALNRLITTAFCILQHPQRNSI